MADDFDANAAVGAYLNGTAPTPETTLRASLYDAVGAKPDYEADLRKTAQAVGMPIDTARADLPFAKRQQALQAIDTSALARMNPVTTSFLSQPENAAIAHDDVSVLSKIEDGIVSTARYITSADDGRGLLRDLAAGVLRANRGASGTFQAAAEIPAQLVQPLVGTVLPANPFEGLVNYFAQSGAAAEHDAKLLSPAGKSMTGNAVSSGVQSLAGNLLTLPLALLPGGQGPALYGMAAQQGGNSYQEAREQGLAPMRALPFAASQAVIEYATEKLPMHLLLKDLNAGTSIGKTILHNMASEIPGEQIATVLQDLNEWAALPENANKPFSSYIADRPSAAAQTLIATVIGVGGQVAVMQAVQSGADNALGIDRKAQAAEEAAAELERLNQAVAASKLRERDPQTFKAFVDQVTTSDETPKEMYISAEALANTLNQGGVTMAQLQQLAPEVAQQMQAENYVPGADIRLPVADLLAAPPELTAPLIDHLRATPDAMSRAEAKSYLEQQGAQLQQQVEAELTRADEQAAFNTDVKAVQEQFQAELDTAGKFRPEVNKAYAALLGNFYATQALRAGVSLPEFMQRYQLQVTGKTPVGGQTLDQAGLPDRLIQTEATDKDGAPYQITITRGYTGANRDTPQVLVEARDAQGLRRGMIDFSIAEDGSLGAEMTRVATPYQRKGIASAMYKAAQEAGYTVKPGRAQTEAGAGMVRALQERGTIGEGPITLTGEYQQAARGSLSFSHDITTAPSVIALLEGADLSSFLHESGHFFLEVQADLAARIAAQPERTPGEQQILDDMGTLLNWFGVKGTPEQSALSEWLGMSIEQRRESHEQFARSFERYTMEGVAPTQELQPLFQRFRSWLVSLYKTLSSLNSNLTDDVRAVMGRMIAGDAAIQATQAARGMGPLFTSPEQAGMTMDEYLAYQGLGAAATGAAEGELDARLMKDMKWLSGAREKALKAAQAQAAALRNGVEAQVRAEVMAQPVYRAWQFLTGKGQQVIPGETRVEAIDTEVETGKLRTSVVKEMSPEAFETLSARRMTSENSGMHPDIAAELFGYASGQEMMAELVQTQPPETVIEGMTDQRMLEEHGDITTPAALNRAADEAVHNELRARVIATELKALQKATKVRGENPDALYGARNTVDLMARAAREYAARIVSRLQLQNLRPQQYAAAEARSAKLALENLGDTAEAAMHKRNQLVNNFATKEAYAAQDDIRKANDFFKRVLKGNAEEVGKTRDYGMVQAARAILAAYGIAGAQKTESALSYIDTLAKNDPGMHTILAERINVMTAGAKPVKTMTVEEFRGLVEEVRSIWYMAKRSRQVEIDGKLVDRESVQADLVARMVEIGIPTRVAGEGMAVTDSERRRTTIRTLGAALRRVESWVGAKDGTASIGSFRRYIWQPVKEAADSYRADKAVYIKRYKALLDTLTLGKDRIDAPELRYVFGHDAGGSGKVELLHAILHTGNESNKRKLLLGRRWATENADGSLDTSRWDAFVARMIAAGKLTKTDFDFAQGVWDLLEETKPKAQKAHRDVFGHYFNEVTADAFTTPFGEYRGGYVPALTDPRVVKDAATRALQEDENSTLAYAFPTTMKGFTKARVEYNAPLWLDLRMVSTHIDKVLLFSHMEQPIRDVRRILSSPEVSTPLHRIDPTAFDGLLTPWLNRAARQTVETRVPGDNGTMRFFSKMRQRAGVTAMFANVSNVVQQITGLSIAAVKVRPKYLMTGLAQYIIAPRQVARTVAESSTYMANRMDSEVANMTDAINDILTNPNVYEKAQNWTAKHAYFMQAAFDNVLGPIIWTGAYNQALEQGQTERDAIRLADSAVRETQGSTLAEDVARIETGNAFVRMFTQFAGYFNMQANLLGTEFGKAYHELGLRKGMGRGFYVFMFAFVVPNVLAELIAQAFKGGPDDEDKDGSTLDDWLWATLVMGNAKAGLAMIPVVGQVLNAGINTWNKKPYDDRITTSPAVSMIESAVTAPHSLYQAVVNGGDTRKAIRDVATLISVTTGLPASAIARPLGYIAGVSENKIVPTSTPDAVRGAITGTPSPESKR